MAAPSSAPMSIDKLRQQGGDQAFQMANMASLAAAKAVSKNSLTAPKNFVVRYIDGDREEKFTFDHERLLSSQVKSLCEKFRVPYDEGDNYHVLTQGTKSLSPVISSTSQLLQLPVTTCLGLRKGVDLVEERLNNARSAVDRSRRPTSGSSALKLTDELHALQSATSADPWIAEEVLEKDGVQLLFRAVMAGSSDGSDQTVEFAMAGLCELLQYNKATEYIEEQQAEELNTAFFRRLLNVLFAPQSESEGSCAPPRATLAGCIFLLNTFPRSCRAAHDAAASGGGGALYPRILTSIDSAAAESAFMSTAATSVFSSICIAANHEDVQDGELYALIRQEVANVRGDEDAEDIVSQCTKKDTLVKELLQSSMATCTDTGRSIGSGGDDKPSDALVQSLENRVKHLEAQIESTKDDLRHRHSVMNKMVSYMKVESSPIVESSIEGIIKFGWDGVHWQRNYTLLHYAAECCEDPSVVELVGLLATDVNQRDDSGLRPIDYARNSQHKDKDGVIKVIERLRRDQRKREKREESAEKLASGVSHASLSSQIRDKGVKEEPRVPLREDSSATHTSGGLTQAKSGKAISSGTGASTSRKVAVETPKEKESREKAELKSMLDELSPMPDSLKSAVDTVVEIGWENIDWPKNFTALHLAAKSGHAGAVDLLVKAKATVDAVDDWKLTALDYAAQSGHEELIGSLQKHLEAQTSASRSKSIGAGALAAPSVDARGASTESTNAAGTTGSGSGSNLHGGVPTGAATPALGANSNASAAPLASNPVGSDTRLPTAGAGQDERLAGMRDEMKKAVETVNRKGWSKIKWPKDFTALHLAARFGDTTAVTLLLEASASPGIVMKDDKGMTPMDYARSKGHDNVIQLFNAAARGELPALPPAPGRSSGPPELPIAGIGGTAVADAMTVAQSNGQQTPQAQSSNVASKFQKTVQQAMTGENFDLLREKLRANAKDSSELGLVELRAKIQALESEREKWEEEKLKLLGDGSSKGITSVGPTTGLGGPLDEGNLLKYVSQLDTFGRDAVLVKLTDKPIVGGMAFSETDAMLALEQLEMVSRLFQKRGLAPKEDSATVAEPVAEPAAEPAPTGKATKGGPPPPGGKAKAKGPPPPGAQQSEEKADDGTAAAGSAAGKSKGPPAPGGKGPPAPGGKGPPAPGGKGPPAPGKGPPPPGGKDGASDAKGGPPPPGGKGPAGPAKGGGAPAKGGKKGGKGGKGEEENLTKPKITPKKPMKALWWQRYNFKAQLQPGETIWDDVKDDMEFVNEDLLVERFSKNAVAPKKDAGKKEDDKKDEVKLLRVITDPQLVVGKEAALKQLPSPADVARAIVDLDDAFLPIDALKTVKDHACPNPDDFKKLTEARKAQPALPLALPEQYMWVIGNLPAYQQRLDCWIFVRTYEERESSYKSALEEFDKNIQCFEDSEMLPSLLGIVLAVGNYLNGGTNRGQADGFDLESIDKQIPSVKDAGGKDLRYFIFETFFNHPQLSEKAAILIDELDGCFSNVNRRLNKDSDGTETLKKQAKIALEDFDACVMVLANELNEKHETMQMILSYFEDPADPFKVRMPKSFSKAKESIDSLVALKDRAKAKYTSLLQWFKVNGMKSSDFMLLWDNLFVPGDLIMNKSEKLKKEVLGPAFCRNKPISIDNLMVLWEFKEPDAKATDKPKRAGRGQRGRAGGGRRRTVLVDSKGKKQEQAGEASIVPTSAAPEPAAPTLAAPADATKASSKGKGKAAPGKAAPSAPAPPSPSEQSVGGSPGGTGDGVGKGPPPAGKGKGPPPAGGKGKGPPPPATVGS